MVLKLLGSAAAEGWPAPFCTCDACRRARQLQGRNIRRRTSYQFGNTIHIDWGPDSYYSMHSFGLDYSHLRHLLITHSHFDHWIPLELLWRREGFSAMSEDAHLLVWGNEAVQHRMEKELLPELDGGLADVQMDFRQLQAFETIDLHEAAATPLPANHADDEQAYIFLLKTPSSSVLVGHDTGWFVEEVWDFLSGQNVQYALIDCTYGTVDKSTGHMGGSYVIETATRLRETKALAADGTAIAQHFSHNCLSVHDELVDYFAPHDIEVAYDGMELVV
ncbi:MAG: MBL fold metallo-hydrolase [Armatimonadota bacterium]